MAVLSMTRVSLYLLSSLLVLLHLVSAVHDGFNMKLIHRDSVESPFYTGNLTFEERAKRFHRQSMVRLNQVASTIRTGIAIKGTNETDSVHPDIIGPPVVGFDGMVYLARVGIGTFSTYMSYLFVVDTGSPITWLQCAGCHPNYCYAQLGPKFPYLHSSTFAYKRCYRPPFCNGAGYCWNTYCVYETQYSVVGLFSAGLIGNETFTFESDDGTINQPISNLIFGCGFVQRNVPFDQPTPIAGILGLARAYPSFLFQIAYRYEGRRFSYCLNEQGNTFLRFGIDAQFQNPEGVISTTQLLIAEPDIHYYLQLRDISVAGYRMNLATGTFDRRQDRTGGCTLDTGTQWTLIKRNIYDLIRQRLVHYFRQLGVLMTQIGGYDLCFQLPNGEFPYPTMVYHFQGDANLVIFPRELFHFGPGVVCLTIYPHDDPTMSVLIGSGHQVNHRFVYGIGTNELSFAREQCI